MVVLVVGSVVLGVVVGIVAVVGSVVGVEVVVWRAVVLGSLFSVVWLVLAVVDGRVCVVPVRLWPFVPTAEPVEGPGDVELGRVTAQASTPPPAARRTIAAATTRAFFPRVPVCGGLAGGASTCVACVSSASAI